MRLKELLGALIAHALHEGGRVHEVREQDGGDRGTRGLGHGSATGRAGRPGLLGRGDRAALALVPFLPLFSVSERPESRMGAMSNTRVLTVIVTDLVGSTETIARLRAQTGEVWRCSTNTGQHSDSRRSP